MKTNKEVIDALQKYLLKHSDFETVARALAGSMIDCNRLYHMDNLEEAERERLLERIELNAKEVMRFAKEGDSRPFKVHNMAPMEDE